jgi:hypothetical protein
MKLDKFLIGILWIAALVLAMDFWLDIRFGFNVFLRGHWRYLANVQTGADPVNKLFYLSLLAFAVLLPLGLYFISRPSRRIRLEKTPKASTATNVLSTLNANTPPPAQPQSKPAAPLTRPPSIVVPTHMQMTNPVEHISTRADTALPPEPAPHQPVSAPNPNSEAAVQGIVAGAGYIFKSPPRIGGMRPSIWAIGTGEVLVIGAAANTYEESARKFNDAVRQVRRLITDSLGDSVQIKIMPFMFIDDGKTANGVDANGINVFGDIYALQSWFAQNPNKPLPDDEKEDFAAYGDYIDTVAGYFNDKV